MERDPHREISLALSGGGIRAMGFHLGVLRRMAELGLLERVKRISTVSGGSLVIGLIYQTCDWNWPSSQEFIDRAYPKVTSLLCNRSFQVDAASQLLNPRQWRFVLSRANLLAAALRQHWGFDIPLSALPEGPEWSINGTTAENGKRFRFKREQIGDWELGYAHAPDLSISTALAVSAAFPVGFGPLVIRTADFRWRKREWNSPDHQASEVKLPYNYLHLYDGGVYDNLGLEPFFHPGDQTTKHAGDYIIASDAGAPLAQGFVAGPLSPFRIKRVMDIMSDQTRALRVRAFVNYLKRNPASGAFLSIVPAFGSPRSDDAEFATSFPTSLARFRRSDLGRLTDYGHTVARDAECKFGLG